jgi:DNA mismatch endonuclease (patch repair protein)
MPQSNRGYWRAKIARNATRERDTSRLLRAQGWRVVRIWGHSLAAPDAVAARVISMLSAQPKRCNNRPRQK